MARIGILGGISHESTREYYDLIHRKHYARYGNCHYPEVVIFSLDFQKFTDFENSDPDSYLRYILEGVQGLEACHVDCIAMAANSPHSVYGQVNERTPTPMLSIAEAVMDRAGERALTRLLLLGIRHTMDATFYPEAGQARGIGVTVPTEEEKTLVDDIIFSELCLGRITDSARQKLVGIINRHEVDGVILGCTELPLIISEGDVDIAVLNTMDIHVEAIMDYISG